ncbi:methylmalonyl-CoA mutase family protein [Luteipulveratus halotolerans]|uniref:Methylmalonyl-CoA mutase alpha/beta chain catalytic domain-containing protein n=1 Tax=Luteipulveratus halotolerans TaxID=1631356 RepID=A0A0L6CIB3_9MICO|nr:methylmalonyl-CoA mutase family protein [Luteipulveratus halotolerans]KNX37444.1 hypothetical protein VV01_10295 [Luteipulveratus halotolerans]
MIELDDSPPGGGRDAWEQAVAAVLTKMRRDDTRAAALDTRTLDGVEVPALAAPRDDDGAAVGAFPYRRGVATADEGWDARALVSATAPDPARVALDELENGSTSLWIRAQDAASLAVVLDEVHLDLAPVVLDAVGCPAADLAAALVERAPQSGRSLHPRTNLGADAFGAALRSGAPADLDSLAQVARVAAQAGVRGVTVDATAAYDAGSGDVTEIAFALAAGVESLRALDEAGIDVRDALALMEFRLSVSDDQFVSIAKLRAARQLWAAVARECGVTDDAAVMHQHAVTARPMLTRYDPWTNLLRTTIAAFAAGVGGAESVTVLPFDQALGEPATLGRRMARNISRLLVEESHLGVVADPAGGSYAVEQLTDNLAEAAWSAFREVERAGGLRKALESGLIRDRIDRERDTRDEQVRTRRTPLTGVSEFPLADESVLDRDPAPLDPQVHSWAHEFEALRDDPAPVPVVLAAMGTVAEHTGRAGFATNALTAGGVPVRSTGATAEPGDVVAAVHESRSPVAVLAASDQQYDEHGAAYVEALRAAGVRWVVLAGRPTDELGALVDDHVAVGDDIVAKTRRIRAELDRAGGES